MKIYVCAIDRLFFIRGQWGMNNDGSYHVCCCYGGLDGRKNSGMACRIWDILGKSVLRFLLLPLDLATMVLKKYTSW